MGLWYVQERLDCGQAHGSVKIGGATPLMHVLQPQIQDISRKLTHPNT